jgi:hypothetical protein
VTTSGTSAPSGTSGISGGSFAAVDRVVYVSTISPSYLIKDSTFLFHETATGHLGVNDTVTNTCALTVKRGATPGNFTFGNNDVAFRNSSGESYLNNAASEAYFYSTLPITLYGSQEPTLFVTSGGAGLGRVGIGATSDNNGRLYVYGEGTSTNYLSIANCNAFKTASTTGYTLAGFIGIYINASVSEFTGANGTYYFPIYSKP